MGTDPASAVLKQLVVNHLGVIVGEGIAAAHSEQLIGIVSKKKLKSGNLCWITNRQQVSLGTLFPIRAYSSPHREKQQQ